MEEFNEIIKSELPTGAPQQGAIVSGTIVHIAESGIFVDIGTKSEGILPFDQVVPQELPRLQVGDEIKVKIIKKSDGEYRLSKRAVDVEEAWNKIELAFRDKEIIQIEIVQKVRNGYLCKAFGVCEGFAHESNFEEQPKTGETYKADVFEFDRRNKKLVFSRRSILREEEEKKRREEFDRFKPGMVVEGVVESLTSYGVFVKLSANVTGLAHISELGWHQVKKPSEVVRKGEKVKVKVLEVDAESQRIALSIKAIQPDPLSLLFPGEEIEGKIDSITDFGVFVELPNKVTGLAHISELSYKRVNHPSELFKARQKVKAKVLKVDLEQRRLALSIKACEQDPWSLIDEKYPLGTDVQGEITQILNNGIVVRIDDFFSGFVPVSEIAVERVESPKQKHRIGEVHTFRIVNIDKKRRRIRLSRKQVLLEASKPRKGVAEKEPPPDEVEVKITPVKVTLGDVIDTSKLVLKEEE